MKQAFKYGWFLLLFVLFFLGSCAGDKTSENDEVLEKPAIDSSEESAAEEESEIIPVDTVFIEDMEFVPAEITIQKGESIVFFNKDIVAHDATEIENAAWGSPTLNLGDSWIFTPEKTTDYFCSLHVVMEGKIVVKE